jgi:multidrug efflux pump subunit AcrA (membrane-fusion protein)
LTIPVPESDAVSIEKGMTVEVTLPELSGKSLMAKVSRTSKVLDPLSKTMRVEIDLENPDGKILSGMYAKALLEINSRENILSLPMIAKVSHKNEDYVLAVVDGKVKRLQVKIGLSNRDYFEVLNDEITSETLVIVQGKSLVKPEQIVEPILKQE